MIGSSVSAKADGFFCWKSMLRMMKDIIEFRKRH